MAVIPLEKAQAHITAQLSAIVFNYCTLLWWILVNSRMLIPNPMGAELKTVEYFRKNAKQNESSHRNSRY